MSRFKGQRVLITGGSSGIGLAGARKVANEGGTPIVTGVTRANIDKAREFLPEDAVVLFNDASTVETGRQLAEAVRPLAPLDGLWLNAGYAALHSLEDVEHTSFDHMIATNMRGPALQMASISSLLSDGAAVVVTSSSSAYEAAPQTSVYAGTKNALIAMARCWAAELASRRIRVNTIVPGPISTDFRDFLSPSIQSAFEAEVVKQTALRRIGSSEETAETALFLLSKAASYITGTQVPVDGGLLMR